MSIFRKTSVLDGVTDLLDPMVRELVESMHYEIMPTDKVGDQIALLPPHRTVSVTCSPKKGIDATLELSRRVLVAGHTPIPHLAARMVESASHARRIVSWFETNSVRNVFVIGGDAEFVADRPYPTATSLMEALCNAEVGLERIGSAAYPDGHATIPSDVLKRELSIREALLSDARVSGWFSTQMCFDAELLVSWLQETRSGGISLPIHLGIPGAIDTTKLLTMGMRLGIGASLRYLSKNRSSVSRLVSPGGYDPMELLDTVAPATGLLGIEALHVFTFNQVASTNDWRAKILAS